VTADEWRPLGGGIEPLLLTVPETAAHLRMDRKTVYRLISSGDLRATDISATKGGRTRTRIRRDDLESFIESRTRTAPARRAS
jgi:excisionase family DNA binding protein